MVTTIKSVDEIPGVTINRTSRRPIWDAIRAMKPGDILCITDDKLGVFQVRSLAQSIRTSHAVRAINATGTKIRATVRGLDIYVHFKEKNDGEGQAVRIRSVVSPQDEEGRSRE